ncbi:DUF6708 domain-containing protein [Pseudomonas sp. NPDC089401]|uniref:DUF6708 domain-containing protein n=1 Tax=Pseudomonas sp. NPDC089401 TaxID=3364462 RepID=UPI0037F776EB
MNAPLLNPPCPGWQEDLPHPFTPPQIAASLGKHTPNHQDDIYLEIPRSQLRARGILSLLTLFPGAVALGAPWAISESIRIEMYWLTLLATGVLLLTLLAIVTCIRTDVALPRDEPIRFNRARQKIYAYNFRCQWWKPFGKWQVVPVSYDWSQVRAERWWQHGGSIFQWGVMLSIVEPGTHNVIDRFNLTFMGADAHAWAYVCTYMQKGPSALPAPGPPKDHNDVLWCEFALRLAPKVEWPADMDQESRTAP